MTPKQFLLAECDNIEEVLAEILRHDYPAGDTEEFYGEIQRRLRLLRGFVEPVHERDVDSLDLFCGELSTLSSLVHHIERSRSGEFSWPFAEELRDLAIPLCDEGLRGSVEKPIFRIHADGGLASYRIHLENDLSQLQVDRRIFNIVFPRTLKHHVLLHAIFGHELGHAVLTIPGLRSALMREVFTPLYSKGPVSTASTATGWLNDPKAPHSLRRVFARYYPAKFNITPRMLENWFEEFFCDLFGLVTFGPAFVSAHQTLLAALDPLGYYFSSEHPPYVVRRQMLWRAAQHLGWHAAGNRDGALKAALGKYWAQHGQAAPPGRWEDVFSKQQVGDALDGLLKVLRPIPNSIYEMPAATHLKTLTSMITASVPPCGADLKNIPSPNLTSVDFRHTLFAGWIVWFSKRRRTSEDQSEFAKLNQLCERGLLQQRAINLYRTYREAV